MKGFKEALKDKININDGRENTIARSIINHLSYEFTYSEDGIYLEKDGRKIVVEQADRKCNNGWMRTWSAKRAKDYADRLIESEKALHNNRPAV